MKTHAVNKDSVSLIGVAGHEAGQCLDNYLIETLRGAPKSHIHRIIHAGEVHLSKRRYRPDSRTQAGDLLRIPFVRTTEKQRPSRNRAQAASTHEFDVVYEDDALLMINRFLGTAIHGGSGANSGAIEQIRRARSEARYLELAHHLNKDTSSLLMIARKRNALVRLYEAIRNDRPKKIYLVLGVGRLGSGRFYIKLPLSKYTGVRDGKVVCVNENGQSAHTVFRVLSHPSDGPLHQVGLPRLTLVEAALKTERTHQIRVHLQSQHCPIIGDGRYGDYQANKRFQKFGLKRTFLHASKLYLDHPLVDEKLVLRVGLLQGLQQFTVMLEDRREAA